MPRVPLRQVVRTVSLAVLLFGTLQAAARAESVEGRVAGAGPGELAMVIYDAQGRPYPNALRLKVDGRTRLGGVRDVSELRLDDAIGADVRQEETGVWRADSVTLFRELDARPATAAKPSPSLRGFLGNPVTRGALTGAATGALASSASGGKAGKGALIGAGVGAAAGLLEGLFSQPQRQAASTDDDYR